MEVTTRIMTRKDVSGNTVIMKAYMDENNNDVHASFHLKLASENRLRLLGDLDIQKIHFIAKENLKSIYIINQIVMGSIGKLSMNPHFTLRK